MTPPRIVILNGTGSVGKSSVARALQVQLSNPFLHVQGDSFFKMLPTAMMDDPDGINHQSKISNGIVELSIAFGPVIERLLKGMRHSVAALASQGNNLIVDDILLKPDDQLQYRVLLERYQTYFVGLTAPLEVLEERERDRRDRIIGLARWQLDRIHEGITYDLSIDTSLASPSECAQKIIKAFEL